jgi:hypothetical protein
MKKLTFAEIAKQNEDNKKRIEEERKKANEKVKRSYRIGASKGSNNGKK